MDWTNHNSVNSTGIPKANHNNIWNRRLIFQKKEGIEAGVLDFHTIKPLDEALLLEEARKTGRVVVAEEHQIWGGLGSAVARFLSANIPCKMEFVAIQDTFAESGQPDELLEKYGLTAPSIVAAVRRLLK